MAFAGYCQWFERLKYRELPQANNSSGILATKKILFSDTQQK